MVIKVAQGSVPLFASLISSIKAVLSFFLLESNVSNFLFQSLKYIFIPIRVNKSSPNVIYLHL